VKYIRSTTALKKLKAPWYLAESISRTANVESRCRHQSSCTVRQTQYDDTRCLVHSAINLGNCQQVGISAACNSHPYRLLLLLIIFQRQLEDIAVGAPCCLSLDSHSLMTAESLTVNACTPFSNAVAILRLRLGLPLTLQYSYIVQLIPSYQYKVALA